MPGLKLNHVSKRGHRHNHRRLESNSGIFFLNESAKCSCGRAFKMTFYYKWLLQVYVPKRHSTKMHKWNNFHEERFDYYSAVLCSLLGQTKLYASLASSTLCSYMHKLKLIILKKHNMIVQHFTIPNCYCSPPIRPILFKSLIFLTHEDDGNIIEKATCMHETLNFNSMDIWYHW